MKIIVAPNAFKDSLTAAEAGKAIVEGIAAVDKTIETAYVPVADGGDGLFAVFNAVFGGEHVELDVTGPLGRPVKAAYLYIPETRTAVVEMARASGLALLKPEERNARATTTMGTGELVLDAVKKGATHIIVGIGGSATNDGGIGFATALGVKFLDKNGRQIRPIGDDLPKIDHIDASGEVDLSGIVFEAVCDVDNPLCGPRGAAAVYGPQKGASPDDVRYLDMGLTNLANHIKDELGKDFKDMPGAGAAGGLGEGLAAFANASLRPGVDVVLDMVGIDKELADADLVITAEGCIDFQTAFGKGPAGVGMRAKKAGVPCIALAGGIAGDITNLHAVGIDAAFSLCSGPMTLEHAIKNGYNLLIRITSQAVRAFLAGRKKA